MAHTLHRLSLLTLAIALGGAGLAGCTTTSHLSESPASPSSAQSIDHQIDTTLARLYANVSDARELVARSKGVLVFPSVLGASFVLGGEYGRGALREGGRSVSYYSTTAGSIGFQAGAQSKAIVYVFNTAEALARFKASNGWIAGIDANVALATLGANGRLDSQTAQAPVTGFVLNNIGLEAGISLQGAKISRLAL